MKSSQIAQLGVAPLASLFLVLSLCAFIFQQRTPMGYRIPAISLDVDHPRSFCGGARTIVVSLNHDGELLLNQDPMTWETITPTVREVMRNRVYPGLYVLVDNDVPYAQFAALIDKLSASTSRIQIGLLTRELRHSDCGYQLQPS